MKNSLCYSYLMGSNKEILNLINDGFIVKETEGDYEVTFPKEKISIYEKFISDNLHPGFWNEYIVDGNIVFMFKHKDGQFQKFILDRENEDIILNLCCKFANAEFTSIKDMILGNNFYRDNVKL